jgi:phage/plasmid-like protein (TIGR03299 family)
MDYFDQGFCVRTPSWHRKETLIMDDLILPRDRERAVKLSGHDFTIIEREVGIRGNESIRKADGWKALLKSGSGDVLNIVRDSYQVIQNDTGWDVLEAIVGEGAKLDTGMTLKSGAVCIVTAFLDEPVRISGDDSLTLPYLVVRWTHDGSGALSARSTSVRVVCANTDEASASEAKRNGTEFTFRHTKNVAKRIEDAKMVLRGVKAQHEAYVELSEELATIRVSREQRSLFVNLFLPMPPEALISERVKNNVEEARASVHALFIGKTIPEAHRDTAYGLRLAGVEYLDHLRGYRNSDSYVGRQLLRTEPAKAQLGKLIKEVIAA